MTNTPSEDWDQTAQCLSQIRVSARCLSEDSQRYKAFSYRQATKTLINCANVLTDRSISRVERKTGVSDGCFSPNLISSP